ncbi:DinB family protein [Corynebacterium caspium]|uniref:DinB family protein n=1 Tax=Corynebacterium caspium TaxID=234828 RepID=UPI0003A37918|nr:DinB family protein [Corynebacterium caspium]
MNTADIFSAFAARIPLTVAAFPQLTAGQLNARPAGHPNSIAWLLWHAARSIDTEVARLSGQEELWPHYRKSFRLGILGESTGRGHLPAEAAKIVVRDQQLLIDYLTAACAALLSYSRSLRPQDWGEVLDGLPQRATIPNTGTGIGPGRSTATATAAHSQKPRSETRGERLTGVVYDAIQHIGQAAYIAGTFSV